MAQADGDVSKSLFPWLRAHNFQHTQGGLQDWERQNVRVRIPGLAKIRNNPEPLTETWTTGGLFA